MKKVPARTGNNMEDFDSDIFLQSIRLEKNRTLQKYAFNIRQFLRAHGSRFVTMIYPLILDRPADAAGLTGYSPRAKNLSGKLRIACSLWFSREHLHKYGLWVRKFTHNAGNRILGRFDCRKFMVSVCQEAGEYSLRKSWKKELQELFRCDGQEFVCRAYFLILDREADRAGLGQYSIHANNLRGKIRIIFSLLRSSERMAKNASFRRHFM